MEARVEELLELVRIDPALRDRFPAQLSGGQQQRVGVARALAANPGVMLMDEPFGAVDPINRERLQNEFLRLQAEVRKTILFVTHDIDEAIKMGDRVAVLREGGHLAQYATPSELLMAPADGFVEDFVGRRPSAEAPGAAAGRRHRPLAGAAGLPRAGDLGGPRQARRRRGPPRARDRRRSPPAGLALRRRSARRDRAAAARHQPGARARARRRDARRPLRPAPGRDPLRAGRGRRGPDRRGAVRGDHLRVPDLAGGARRGAPGGGEGTG